MQVKCPTCKQPTTWEENPHRPFCCERCKLVDLGQWATESYRIAGAPLNENQQDKDTDERD